MCCRGRFFSYKRNCIRYFRYKKPPSPINLAPADSGFYEREKILRQKGSELSSTLSLLRECLAEDEALLGDVLRLEKDVFSLENAYNALLLELTPYESIQVIDDDEVRVIEKSEFLVEGLELVEVLLQGSAKLKKDLEKISPHSHSSIVGNITRLWEIEDILKQQGVVATEHSFNLCACKSAPLPLRLEFITQFVAQTIINYPDFSKELRIASIGSGDLTMELLLILELYRVGYTSISLHAVDTKYQENPGQSSFQNTFNRSEAESVGRIIQERLEIYGLENDPKEFSLQLHSSTEDFLASDQKVNTALCIDPGLLWGKDGKAFNQLQAIMRDRCVDEGSPTLGGYMHLGKFSIESNLDRWASDEDSPLSWT